MYCIPNLSLYHLVLYCIFSSTVYREIFAPNFIFLFREQMETGQIPFLKLFFF